MIVIGWGRYEKSLGSAFVAACGNCLNTSRFNVLELSRQIRLFWVIPCLKWQCSYHLSCPICGSGTDLPDLATARLVLAHAFRDPYNIPPSIRELEGLTFVDDCSCHESQEPSET